MRGRSEQFHRFRHVLRHAMALVIQAGQQMLTGRIASACGRVELFERLGVMTVVISEDARFIKRCCRDLHEDSLFRDFVALYTALFHAECTIKNGVAHCRIHAV